MISHATKYLELGLLATFASAAWDFYINPRIVGPFLDRQSEGVLEEKHPRQASRQPIGTPKRGLVCYHL